MAVMEAERGAEADVESETMALIRLGCSRRAFRSRGQVARLLDYLR